MSVIRRVTRGVTTFIRNRRKESLNRVISVENTSKHPMQQFDSWYKEAEEFEYGIEVNAFVLSTLSHAGYPNTRYVLMRKYNNSGLTFFSRLESPKAQEMHYSDKVSGVFYWPTLNR